MAHWNGYNDQEMRKRNGKMWRGIANSSYQLLGLTILPSERTETCLARSFIY